MSRPLGFIVIPKNFLPEIGFSVSGIILTGILWNELVVKELLEDRLHWKVFLSLEKDFGNNTTSMWIHSVLHALMFLFSWDFLYYWAHRWLHVSNRWWGGWWIHEVHHRSKVPNLLSGFSFNFLEPILSTNLYQELFFVFFPAHATSYILIRVVQFFSTMHQHSGYYLFPNGWESNPALNWLYSSLFHDVHHSHVHYNYGAIFSIWDRIFGTIHPKYLEMTLAIEERIANQGKPTKTVQGQ